jgi:acyl-coenzyme A synthetase/AMP-(fatty) acid ligase
VLGSSGRPPPLMTESIQVVSDMPETPSGKILRRVPTANSNTLDKRDENTFANPDMIELIRSE